MIQQIIFSENSYLPSFDSKAIGSACKCCRVQDDCCNCGSRIVLPEAPYANIKVKIKKMILSVVFLFERTKNKSIRREWALPEI